MATKRKRSGRWQYTIRRKELLGRPIYLTFDSEREGDAHVARLELLLDRGEVPEQYRQTARVTTLGEVLTVYLEGPGISDDDRKICKDYGPRLRRVLTDGLDYRWAETLVAGLKADRLAPSTIRHHVGALARCIDWAARRGDIAANPLRLLPRGYATYQRDDPGRRVDASRDRRLQPWEEDAIRRVLAGGVRPDGKQRPLELKDRHAMALLFDLALETAMRLSEMTTLATDRVDLDQSTIFLDRTKSGRRRQVPLTTIASGLLRAHLGPRPWPAMTFPWLKPYSDRAEVAGAAGRLSRAFSRVFDHAGCPDLRFHDLRHEATSRFFERTSLSDLEIAKITGHQDPRMLARYANLRASNLAGRLW